MLCLEPCILSYIHLITFSPNCHMMIWVNALWKCISIHLLCITLSRLVPKWAVKQFLGIDLGQLLWILAWHVRNGFHRYKKILTMLENPHTFLVACLNSSLSVKTKIEILSARVRHKKAKFLGICASQLDIRDNKTCLAVKSRRTKDAFNDSWQRPPIFVPSDMRNLTVLFVPQAKKGAQLKIEPNKILTKALQRFWYVVRRPTCIKSHRQKIRACHLGR